MPALKTIIHQSGAKNYLLFQQPKVFIYFDIPRPLGHNNEVPTNDCC